MMLLLVLDVFNQPIFVGARGRKAAVTVLPAWESWKQALLLYPDAGRDFDALDKVCEGEGRMKAREDVHVVFNRVDSVQVGVLVADYSPSVAKKLFAMLFDQHPLSRLCREG